MLEFFVPGSPKAQGSKVRTQYGMREANPGLKDWRGRITCMAETARPDGWNTYGAWIVAYEFVMARPKADWSAKAGKVLKDSAKAFPTGRVGDLDKLVRACNDSLTGVLINDDAAVVLLEASKRYQSDPEERIGVWIRVAPCQ